MPKEIIPMIVLVATVEKNFIANLLSNSIFFHCDGRSHSVLPIFKLKVSVKLSVKVSVKLSVKVSVKLNMSLTI